MDLTKNIKQSPIIGVAGIGGGTASYILYAKKGGDGYQISKSLRFNTADDTQLNNSMSVAGDRSKFTFSFWVKFASIDYAILSCGSSSSGYFELKYNNNGQLEIHGENITNTQTIAVFRDFSAWYHIMLVIDKANGTAADRAIFYVNGTRQTLTTPNQGNSNPTYWGHSSQPHRIGGRTWGGGNQASYYLTEFYHLDGVAATPSDFGETDDYGVWQPKAFSGSYGTIGFHLNFSDNSNTTATTLGKDSSGQNNNYTPVNFSIAAGGDNDSLTDVPTSYGNDTGSGGEVRGNFCTWNPLDVAGGGVYTLSNGNLSFVRTNNDWKGIKGTMGVSSGKWYYETVIAGTFTQDLMFGICSTDVNVYTSATIQDDATERNKGMFIFCDNGKTQLDNNARANYSSSLSSGDTIGIAFDLDTGTAQFYKNGSGLGSVDISSSPLMDGHVVPFIVTYYSGTIYGTNFGQRAWYNSSSVPSGYKALCTQNLPDPTVLDGSVYFQAITRTGGGTNQSFTTLRPGLVWEKNRDVAGNYYIYDANRGDNKYLNCAATTKETSGSGAMAFSANGYVVDSSFDWPGSQNIIDWVWDAGSSNVSNGNGSITSTVRANTDAGFSVVKWTGTRANDTVGHGLSSPLKFLIVKNLDENSGTDWLTWHTGLANGGTGFIRLNTNGQEGNASSPWNSTIPTNSVFSLGVDTESNGNGDEMIAYCFADIEGYCKFSSYVGNGQDDNQFIFTGFKPKLVLFKYSSSAGDWLILDTSRRPNGPTGGTLVTNVTNYEDNYYTSGQVGFDFLSNGFKIRHNGSPGGDSGRTIIYAAFAEHPFKTARAY